MGFLLLAVLAFVLLLVAVRPALWTAIRATRRAEWKMDVAARICEAAARDAFQIELDYSLGSLASLDHMIAHGWKSLESRQGMGADTRRALAAYFGGVFVRSYAARWSIIGASAEEPRLEFPKSCVNIDPFALIEYKMQNPESVSLATLGERLHNLVEERSHIDWHTQGATSVTFDPEALPITVIPDEQ